MRKSHLHQALLNPGSQCELTRPREGAQTRLTWGIRNWGARLWCQGPAGPVCPRCTPSWQPLWGPARKTSPLPPDPEGHTESLHTHCSPCSNREQPCTHGCPSSTEACGPPAERRLQGLGRAGLYILQALNTTFNSCCSPAQSTCLSSPSPSLVGTPGIPESRLVFERAPHPIAWTHHCRDLRSWLFLWSLCSWLPLVCLALGDREWGQSRMEHPVQGSCQGPMPGLTQHQLPQGSRASLGLTRGCPPSLPVCLCWEKEQERRKGAAPGRSCGLRVRALWGCWASWGGQGARGGGGGGGGGVTHRAARLLILPFLAVQTADLSLGTRMRDSLKETPAEKQTDERTDRQTDGREKGRNKRGTKSPGPQHTPAGLSQAQSSVERCSVGHRLRQPSVWVMHS